MSKYRHQFLIAIALLTSTLLDLGSKYWAHKYLLTGERQVLIPGLINLLLTTNTGIAFSIGQGHQLIAQTLTAIVFLTLLVVYIRRYVLNPCQHPGLELLAVSIIIGAAAGNLLERLCYGTVTDFFEFAFINFPVFNTADILINIGVVLILISAYCSKKGRRGCDS